PPFRMLVSIYALAVSALVVLATAVATTRPVSLSHDDVVLAAMLTVMVFLARRFPVQLAPKTKTMVDTAPLFAAVLLLPPPVAISAVAVGTAAAEAARNAPWFQTLFNASEIMVRAAAGA